MSKPANDTAHPVLGTTERALPRENNFDAVRLLAAAVVIFGHAHPLTNVPSPGLFGNSVQALAVKIFFVISGFLICVSWRSDPDPVRYLGKRAIRIFPALIVICLVSVFVVGPWLTTMPTGEYLSSPSTYHYLRNILLFPIYNLPGVFADNTYPVAVNGSLWSLPVEFAMYLVMPVVLVLVGLLRNKWMIWAFAIGLCATSLHFVRINAPVTHPVFYGTDLISALDVAPYFFLGAAVAYTGLQRFLRPSLGLFLVGFFALFQPQSAFYGEVALFILMPVCVLSLCLGVDDLLKGAGRFGDFSYGLYLYGFLIQQIVNHLSHNSLSALQNTFISLPIALACAALSWHFVEKPALARKPSKRAVSQQSAV